MRVQPVLALMQFGSLEQQRSINLRRRALRLPLGLDFTPAELSAESGEFHFGAFVGDVLVGVLLFRPLPPASEGRIKMRQVAVDEACRGQGIGEALVRFAESEMQARGFREVELNAREAVHPFYEKLGYAREGQGFLEVGIPHVKMRKRLAPSA